VLRTIQADENPPRAYEILQELRDISSMAMEYFDEKIVPGFKCQVLAPMKLGSPSYNLALESYSALNSRVVSHGSGFSLSLRYPDSPTSLSPSRYPHPLSAPDSPATEPVVRPRSLLSDFNRQCSLITHFTRIMKHVQACLS